MLPHEPDRNDESDHEHSQLPSEEAMTIGGMVLVSPDDQQLCYNGHRRISSARDADLNFGESKKRAHEHGSDFSTRSRSPDVCSDLDADAVYSSETSRAATMIRV